MQYRRKTNMDKEKTAVFEKFAKQAAKRMEERKKQRKENLKIGGDEDMVMEIRGLSDTELNECFEFSDDPIEVDRYTIYMASPTLQQAAKYMVGQGSLQPSGAYKITEMFSSVERNYIVRRILMLSGASGEADIEVLSETEEIKNS